MPQEVPVGEHARSLREAGFRGGIRTHESLAPYTTWRIGGPAEILATPEDRADVVRALEWARGAGVPWRILGNGSNLLVREAGVRGLVLRVRKVLDSVTVDGTTIRAGAGASLPSVANLAASCGLAGLEFGAGIPGTVGGAIVMNAGWHEFEIGNVVVSVDVIDAEAGAQTLTRVDCAFGYRHSIFRERRSVVLECTLELSRDDPEEVRDRLETFAESRRANQPTERPSCGSVFLKPPGDFAGRLIDAAGLKGMSVGGVEVSPKHANFFVNTGGATAEDVLALVEKVEDAVRARFGVRLEREFEIW